VRLFLAALLASAAPIEHHVAQHGFSIELPASWSIGTAFLATPTFREFRRRTPGFAREYVEMLRAAPRRGIWLIAFDGSPIALAHATRKLDRSYGLFPTIFVVAGRVSQPVPLAPATSVVPRDWAGYGADQAPYTYCNPKPLPGEACRYTFSTYAGHLGMIERRAARRPAGRPSLFVGWAGAVDVDALGHGIAPRTMPPAYDLAWTSLRYNR
jgi:hypothetical protein